MKIYCEGTFNISVSPKNTKLEKVQIQIVFAGPPGEKRPTLPMVYGFSQGVRTGYWILCIIKNSINLKIEEF